ncbi:MAG TPA: hypothetical protein DEA43_02595 [Candidatus Moranbacteria bacterium]|nr:hypothetical protein [Candidatus Moranbacteria bacterium]HBT45752.1 hypothetical protein [Candidatus Moranbacteria bacterium]
MPQNTHSKYQEFLHKNKHVIEGVKLSCKKRLTNQPKITAEELFSTLNKEFGDVYYEDKSFWLAYLKKNMSVFLREISENARLESLTMEQKTFLFNNENKDLQPKEIMQTTNKHRTSSLAGLHGDEHIEKSLPTGDIDDQEDPVEFTIVIPPREMPKKEIETELKHPEVEPELDLHLKPISKKTLDEKRGNDFPFGKGMLK